MLVINLNALQSHDEKGNSNRDCNTLKLRSREDKLEGDVSIRQEEEKIKYSTGPTA